MKNLKRVLSLALSGIMLVGMMAVGASAVDAKDFTDASEINNKDAVSTMSALGVILGKDTGAFDPEGNVTRAEMAKMLCVAMNGGKDFTYGTKTTPTYTDIKGHWAESYIEYCTATGIINGQGDGTFAPAATVTGSQAAKMILTAMGYDAANAGMVGLDWEINTNVLAGQKDLYKDVDINVSAPLNRDDAAQMLFNGINATMVEYVYNAQTVNGTLTMVPQVKNKTVIRGGSEVEITMLAEKFDIIDAIGYMSDYSYNEDKDEFTYTFSVANNYGAALSGAGTNWFSESATLTTNVDYTHLFGQKVKALYKNNTAKDVFGIFENDSKILVTDYVGKLPTSIAANAESVKFAGTTYKLDKQANAIKVINKGQAAGAAVLSDENSSSALASYSFIDNDNNGKVDVVVKTPLELGKVTYVSSKAVTLSVAGVGTQDLEDIEIYEDVKKDDQVLVVRAANSVKGKLTVEKADVQTGTLAGSRTGNKWQIDGSWLTDTTADATLRVNDEVEYIALGGNIYYIKVTSGAQSLDDVVMVLGTEFTAAGTISGVKNEASVMFADGSKKTVTIVDVNGDPVDTSNQSGLDTAIPSGALYTYTTNNSGDYTLTPVASGNKAGYDDYAITALKDSNNTTTGKAATAGGWKIADDAVVFVLSSKTGEIAKGKVYTGKELKAQTASKYTVTGTLMSKVNGFQYAQVVAVKGASASDGLFEGIVEGDNYGYLTSNTWKTKENGKEYRNLTIFNGTDTITVKEEVTAAQLSSGTVITYDVVDSATVKNVKAVSPLKVAAVTGWDEKNIAFLNTADATTHNSTVTSETVVLYVDSSDNAGSEGAIREADEPIDGLFIPNVAYYDVTGNNDYVELIVVDTDNKWAGAQSQTIVGNVTATDIKAMDNGMYTLGTGVTVTGITNNSSADSEDLLLFKFEGRKAETPATQAYTLKIDLKSASSNGGAVYTETSSALADNASYIFYVDQTGAHIIASATGTLKDGTALVSGTAYQYAITGADGITYLKGSFVAK